MSLEPKAPKAPAAPGAPSDLSPVSTSSSSPTRPQSGTAAEQQEVIRKTRAGVAWSVVTGLLSRGIGLVTTLLLTRFMDPEQSGSVNVALTLVNLISVMTTMGLGQYVASQAKPSTRVAWNAALLHNSVGLIAFGLTLLCGQRMMRMLGDVNGTRFIPLLVLTFVMERLLYVPERVLIAHLRFRQVGTLRSVGELCYCGGALLSAMGGLGPWSVVVGNLLRQAVRLAMVLWYTGRSEWLLAEGPDRATMVGMLRFGLPMMIASIAAFAGRRADNLLVSHYYGTDVVGLYNLAYNLAEVPALQLTDMVCDALAPSFARLSREERQRSMAEVMTAIALGVFPLAAGLGLVAPTLAHLMPKSWAGVGPYLLVLSVLSLSRPVAMLAGVYLQSLRRTGLAASLGVFQVVSLLGSLVLVGVVFPTRPLFACYAVGATAALGSAAAIWALRVVDGMPIWLLLRAHLLPLPALSIMALAVLGVTRVFGPQLLRVFPWGLAIAQVLVGGIAYLTATLVLLPGQSRQIVNVLRALRQRRRT